MPTESSFAWISLLGSLGLILIFHTLFFDAPYGWPFMVLVGAIVGLAVVARLFIKKPVNHWAYIFLLPLVLLGIAQGLYANETMRVFSVALAIVSGSLFVFWLYSSKLAWSSVKTFWPMAWWLETWFPLTGKGPISKIGLGAHGRQIFVGVMVSLPFLLVFLGLFLAADPLIWKVLKDTLHLDDPEKLFVQLVMDVLLGAFFIRWTWTAFTRALHERHIEWTETKESAMRTAMAAFLGMLNLLFIGFIGFQFVYFFGGQAIVESYGLTYADYAREGFFQLFTVSVLVFAILFVIACFDRIKSVAIRVLSLFMIVQSWVVIASGIKRLSLYVDAYGMSVLRYWALAGLVVAAIALLILAGWLLFKGSFHSLERILAISALTVFSGLFLINVEHFVVDWNANRSASEVVAPDYTYPIQLSTDAVPAYVAWLKKADPSTPMECHQVYERVRRAIEKDGNATDADTVKERLDLFQKRTGGNLPLQYMAYTALEDGQSTTAGYVVWQPIMPFTGCALEHWIQTIRMVEKEALEKDMADPRKWTWSGQKALEAYRSL